MGAIVRNAMALTYKLAAIMVWLAFPASALRMQGTLTENGAPVAGTVRMLKWGYSKPSTSLDFSNPTTIDASGRFDITWDVWISPDPARQFASPYAYSPNPINSIDPDGKASVGVGATFSGTYGPAGAHLSLGVTFDTDALARGDFGNVLFVDGAVGAGARMGVGASGRVRLSYSPDAPEVGRSQSMSREVIAGKGVVFGVKESFDMKSSSHNRSLEISAGLGEEWAGGLTAEVKDTKTFGSFLRELFTGKNDERLK